MSVSLKLQCASDIRRVTVQENITFSELRQLVKDTFGGSSIDGLVFKYKDSENEFITLTNDNELFDAIRLSKSAQHTLKILIVIPWLPISVARSIPFQLDSSRLKYCGDRIKEASNVSCNAISTGVSQLRQRVGPCKPIVKKGLVAAAFLWWLCHGCSLFILLIAGLVGYRYFGLFSNLINDNRARFHQSLFNNYAPSAPPVERAEQNLYPANYSAAPVVQPHERNHQFQDKLKQLNEMGFTQAERNIGALIKNNGNLLEAVKTLLDE